MNWIWTKENTLNCFAEFKQPFCYGGGKAQLRISADYRYAAYVNGTFVPGSQYADLPDYKCVNTVDITPFVKPGENTLRVIAWHLGADYSVCRTMPAGVAFEISVDGCVVARSDENTLCRKAYGYRGGDLLTPQLGCGWHYDFTDKGQPWAKAQPVQTGFAEAPRPIRHTVVAPLRSAKVVAQGVFQYCDGSTAAEKMQNAWMRTLRFDKMTGKNRLEWDGLQSPVTFTAQDGDGLFVLADLGAETCGHLSFSVTVDRPCKMLLGWGEHLADLRLRTAVGPRNFAAELSLQAGENRLDDYLMRVGCRYLCIFVENTAVTVAHLGIREVGYPFAFPEKDFGDALYNKIYETGRRTLYLSAHEHYEDCPWREQALYGMDSRNQMLFGYGAFEEYAFPRANLLLIAKAMQENGLIALTAPAQMTITIPAFTAYWLIAIGENAQADFQPDFAEEILPYAEKAMNKLLSQEGSCGLDLFTDPAYWNFHEWSAGLDGGEIFRSAPVAAESDACLTALTVLAARQLAALERRMGNQSQAQAMQAAAQRLQQALEGFYDPNMGLYGSYRKGDVLHGWHAYTQSLILCCGGVPQERTARLCAALKDPAAYGLIPATFSSLQMQYQALIQQGQLDYCVQQVVEIFSKMLFSGATSYWETELGEADFEDAGSLCHGWSAVCCWILDQYKNGGGKKQ